MYAVECKLDCPHGQFIDTTTESSPNNLAFQWPMKCSKCFDETENWICLTCKDVFCSRYVNGHAEQHALESTHSLALSLSDLSVWCYECSSYVKLPEQKPIQDAMYRLKFGEEPLLTPFEMTITDSQVVVEIDSHLAELAERVSRPIGSESKPELGVIAAAPLLRTEVTDGAKSPAVSTTAALLPPIAIFWNEKCVKHCIPGHPEQPKRVDFMLQKLRQLYPAEVFQESTPISKGDLLRFHSKRAVEDFFSLCSKAEEASKVVPIDGDTAVMKDTRDAALCAAGAVLNAIDAIYNPAGREFKSAFCCVRPPGHHAERDKSMGFCFLNNAAIGAKYAQEVYGISKVAVLDFDVHHGNGTEEGFRDFHNLFYGSTHEKDNYPGTGEEPRMKGELALREVDRRIVDRYLNAGPGSEAQFRIKWREVVEEMIRFRPDLVIISAGFDAHIDDPLGNCALRECDFEWGTDIVMEACLEIDSHSPPPVISVLEGGYNIQAIANSAAAHVASLAKVRSAPSAATGDEVSALAKHIESLNI